MRPRRAACVALRTALLIGLFSTSAISAGKPADHPRWAVSVVSDDRSWYIDEPIGHAQEYLSFPGTPKRFDHDHKLSGKSPAEIKDRVEAQPLGEAPGYRVRQVTHTINDHELVNKMILVEGKSGEFCKTYPQQMSPSAVSVETACLAQVGSETILATSDSYTGNSGQRVELYSTFDKDGPILPVVGKKSEELLKGFFPHRAPYFERRRL